MFIMVFYTEGFPRFEEYLIMDFLCFPRTSKTLTKTCKLQSGSALGNKERKNNSNTG